MNRTNVIDMELYRNKYRVKVPKIRPQDTPNFNTTQYEGYNPYAQTPVMKTSSGFWSFVKDFFQGFFIGAGSAAVTGMIFNHNQGVAIVPIIVQPLQQKTGSHD